MPERQVVPPDDLKVVGCLALLLLRLRAGGFEGNRGVVFTQSSFLLPKHEGRVVEQGFKITILAAYFCKSL